MQSWKHFDLKEATEHECLVFAANLLREIHLNMRILDFMSKGGDSGIDAVVAMEWQSRVAKYACKITKANTPRNLEQAVMRVLYYGKEAGVSPMIVVPYLSEENLVKLAERDVSGIDLCGNAFISSKSFRFWRSGQPNRFKTPSVHLNPFRGDNSVFTRCFLLHGDFESLSHLRSFASDRVVGSQETRDRGMLLLGTASKTIQSLEEQLIVRRSGGQIKLLDRRKLMAQLKLNYQPPISRSLTGKTPLDQATAWTRLSEVRSIGRTRAAATGSYSATHYGVLSPSDKLSIYVDDLREASALLELRPGKAFANCELIETNKNFPYFDLHEDGGVPWASIVQTWLELANGNAREQEAAEELERSILASVVQSR